MVTPVSKLTDARQHSRSWMAPQCLEEYIPLGCVKAPPTQGFKRPISLRSCIPLLTQSLDIYSSQIQQSKAALGTQSKAHHVHGQV